MLDVASPKVDNDVLGFVDVQQKVVVCTPNGHEVDLPPVLGLVSLVDETHQIYVVRKLHIRLTASLQELEVGEQSHH